MAFRCSESGIQKTEENTRGATTAMINYISTKTQEFYLFTDLEKSSATLKIKEMPSIMTLINTVKKTQTKK